MVGEYGGCIVPNSIHRHYVDGNKLLSLSNNKNLEQSYLKGLADSKMNRIKNINLVMIENILGKG